jgi:hypothetical protein
MFCTTVVFGFAAQRLATVKQAPLMIFDPGIEDMNQIIEDGIPDHAGQWGMDLARVVAAEGAVKPLQGERMMRLEPRFHETEGNLLPSRVYQVIDLRTLPIHLVNSDAEVLVTASFCTANSEVSSRYVMRVFALDEAPELATTDFWDKSESDGVVSESQRFDTNTGDGGWHTFSLKMRLAPGSKTHVLILGNVAPKDATQQAFVHYLDNVQVSLITQQPISSL